MMNKKKEEEDLSHLYTISEKDIKVVNEEYKKTNKDLYFVHIIAFAHQLSVALKHLALQMQPSPVRLAMLDAASKNENVVRKFRQHSPKISLEEIEELSAGIGSYLTISSKNINGAAAIAEFSKLVFDGDIRIEVMEELLKAIQREEELKASNE